jgi:predicted nuclease of predicted toxin-antitoxin system
MKILVDMNLSPGWVTVLTNHEISAVHWSTVGDPRAEDAVIMEWARKNNYAVFTHDLDFGGALALTQAEGPSVIQVRAHDVTPKHLELVLIDALAKNRAALESGCLIVLDEARSRMRILPLTLRPYTR